MRSLNQNAIESSLTADESKEASALLLQEDLLGKTNLLKLILIMKL